MSSFSSEDRPCYGPSDLETAEKQGWGKKSMNKDAKKAAEQFAAAYIVLISGSAAYSCFSTKKEADDYAESTARKYVDRAVCVYKLIGSAKAVAEVSWEQAE